LKLTTYFSLTLFIINGCALMTHKVKEPILLDQEPRVSFRYEYESTIINVPYFIEDKQPQLINFRITHRENPLLTLIEQDFVSGDQLQLLVPKAVLSTDPMGNLAIIQPRGGDYETIELLFSLSAEPIINLSEVLIREKPFIVTGTVLQRKNNNPVHNARLYLIARNKNTVYGLTYADSLGFFRFELKDQYGTSADFYLRVETDHKFPDRVIPVDFAESKRFEIQILIGASPTGAGIGAIYRVKSNGTPFRRGPENGADIQFFLAAGDIIIVTKVAGNRLHGFVEMVTSDETKVHPVYGWVQEQNVELSE